MQFKITEAEIVKFINDHFKADRKKLIQKINNFLKAPLPTNELQKTFTQKLKIPFKGQTFSSGKIRNNNTKKSEVGDISDIWTFCLNTDIKVDTKNKKLFDWDFEDYLNTGKEVHLCRLWTNWFLPVYYLETTYEFTDRKKKFNQYGRIPLADKKEIEIVKKIIGILDNKNYIKLDTLFLNKKLKGISTDCSESKNATIFECLFSDLCMPTEHIRKSIRKNSKTNTQKPELSFTDYLDDQRQVILSEAEIYHNSLSPITIKFDKEYKITETESRGNLNGKKYSTIKIKYD
ncbi:hypothetical protein [Ferruginibacter profundus]